MSDDTPAQAEEWRPVVGHEGAYEVSNLGRVRSLGRMVTHVRFGRPVEHRHKGRVLKLGRTPNGYSLAALGKRSATVHRLVLEAFVGPCPEGMQCAHNDGNRANNVLANLRWATPRDNNLDKHQHGTMLVGDRHPRAWNRSHCNGGHDLSAENVAHRSDGGRRCRACRRARERERRRRDPSYAERVRTRHRDLLRRLRADPAWRARSNERSREAARERYHTNEACREQKKAADASYRARLKQDRERSARRAERVRERERERRRSDPVWREKKNAQKRERRAIERQAAQGGA